MIIMVLMTRAAGWVFDDNSMLNLPRCAEVYRSTTYLGAFGGPSLKPLNLWSNSDKICELAVSMTVARAALPPDHA